jgi:two-component system cell cycle response regulator
MDKPRLLIIDDDPFLRKTLASILGAKGYVAFVAKNGTEGLAVMEQNEVDLALIDLGLPDIPGMTVLERIKADYPFTEAIILTGNATLDSAVDATNRGAFSYLVKPYEIDQLLLQIRRAEEKRRALEEIVSRTKELERINAELTTLYEVSLTISRTIDLDELLAAVLPSLVSLNFMLFEQVAAAFLIKDDILSLVSHIGFSESQLEKCSNICLGDCICGLAAKNGDIIISSDASSDPRHSLECPGALPHGNVALPLKIVDRVIGVITLKTRAGMAIDAHTLQLLSTLGNQIGIAVNNARLYEEARNFSLHDPLTGLANRRLLNIQLEKSIDAAKRYGEKLSVIMLDIDHFKKYNDEHGHVEGDRMLVRIGEILLEEMRSSDYVFRYGGEEFFAILTQTDLSTACEVAERLRKSVEKTAGVTISLGVSTYREIVWDDENLIKTADAALYQAKQKGRNRVVANMR